MANMPNDYILSQMERLRRDIEKSLFISELTSTMASAPPKPLTSEDVKSWIGVMGKRMHQLAEPRFIIKSAQEQRRTPITGHYYQRGMRTWTKPRKQRKCSRRKWQAMNRKPWKAIPIYAEPVDALVINGLTLVTERQYQALKDATIALTPASTPPATPAK